MLSVDQIQTGGVLVLKLKGRLDAKTSPDFETLINGLITSGQTHLLLDCEELNYVSSAGLRVFLSSVKLVDPKKGKVVFAGLSNDIWMIFRMAGLPQILSIYTNREAALKAMAPAGA